MNFSVRSQKDNLSLLKEAGTAAKLSARYYGRNRLGAFLHGVRLARTTRMRPLEAFEYGAFVPGADAQHYLSKRTCSALQQRLNSKDWFWMTEDKGIFNSICEARSVPVPACLALLFRDSAGVSQGKPIPPSSHAWARTLADLDLQKVVIKPCRHSYGRGLLIPVLEGGQLQAGGTSFSNVKEMADYMFAAPELTSWIIQEKVRSHPDLDAFSGTDSLQTMRIYSHVDQHGNIHLIDAFLKVIGADAQIDNFQHGALGNFIAPIDVASGQLEPAISRTAAYRWIRLDRHPKTANDFSTFQIPLWSEAKQLVTDAAAHFKPIRSLGWDVAVTADGPVVIEANIRWDPPNWNPETVRRVKHVLENPNDIS